MPIPFVSVATAGVLLLIQMLLTATVVMARRSNKQSLGDGGNADVLRAMRRHGNFAENAAIFVAALTLFELSGAHRTTVEMFAAIFVVGRISHAIALTMKNTVNIFRIAGIAATIGVGLVLGVRLLMIALPQLGAAS
jgi:uncharacterized protein